MPVTVPQSEANLLAYFRNGDKPNEDQFEEFISTMFYLNAQTQAAAEAAQDAAEAVAALGGFIPFAFARMALGDTSPEFVVQRNVGCTLAVTGVDGVKYTIAVTFATAAADSNYPIVFGEQSATITGRTTGGFTFTTPISATTAHLSFIIMP